MGALSFIVIEGRVFLLLNLGERKGNNEENRLLRNIHTLTYL